jgi:hypothetical protein
MADKARLHRSELAVPGTNVRAMEKAPTLGADVVFLDLEDAVAPDDKEQARANVIDALGAQDWTGTAVSVRINGLDTHWCYRDVVDVVEARGEVLDTILVPKVGAPSDVEFVATLLDQIEQRNGWPAGRIGIHILIETALGMANVEAIAAARPDRLEAMVFGVADYAASVQARTTNIGGANPDYAVLTDPDDAGDARPTGATSGTSGSPGWSPPAARKGCGRSTVRSATTTMRTATARRRVAPPRSAARASGRSTPRRSRSPTRSSRPPRPRSSAPSGSSRRWRRPRRKARARSRSVVKAQIHAGGRGKGGGVKLAKDSGRRGRASSRR